MNFFVLVILLTANIEMLGSDSPLLFILNAKPFCYRPPRLNKQRRKIATSMRHFVTLLLSRHYIDCVFFPQGYNRQRAYIAAQGKLISGQKSTLNLPLETSLAF